VTRELRLKTQQIKPLQGSHTSHCPLAVRAMVVVRKKLIESRCSTDTRGR
jgi:hypothetical protein